MTLNERKAHNRAVIERVALMCPESYIRSPSYRQIITTLQREGWESTSGEPYTMRALYRMLQRGGVPGIWGLCNGYHRPGESDISRL